MAKSSKAWLEKHRRDPYVKQARSGNYRARAVYKLREIDQKDRLFRRGQTVVDLGAAPGSWSQYALERVGPDGRVIAVDVLEMDPIGKVQFIRGDFTERETLNACLEALKERAVDLVISDMAPNLSGIRSADQARSLELAELALDFARRVLTPEGAMLIKIFQGSGTDRFRQELSECFQKVTIRKPKASKDASREFYMLARGYHV